MVTVSYEPDLFGRIRNTVQGFRSSAQASAGDLESVSLTLHGDLANNYFQLRTLDAEEQLLNSTVSASNQPFSTMQSSST